LQCCSFDQELKEFSQWNLKNTRTAKGLNYIDGWGPLRRAAGAAAIMAVYARGLDDSNIDKAEILKDAEHQVCFVLSKANCQYKASFGTRMVRIFFRSRASKSTVAAPGVHVMTTSTCVLPLLLLKAPTDD
jgi:hypothetical protein